MSEVTALMEQYYAIKAKHPGAILLFQVGDFYETFEEDARILSTILGLTLTRRNNGKAEDVLMAGFPVRAAEGYVQKLTDAGYRVAICDQVESPRKGKKIVRREVTQVASPGVVWFQGEELTAATYLAAFWAYKPTEAVLFLSDITSSGRVLYYAGPLEEIERLLAAFAPVEAVVYAGQESLWQTLYAGAQRVEPLPEWLFDTQILTGVFAEVYGYSYPSKIYLKEEVARTFAAFLSYLRDLKQTGLTHLSFPQPFPIEKAFFLHPDTLRNLEVIEPLHRDGKSLLDVLRFMATAAGLRLMRARLAMPLRDIQAIEERLNKVQALYDAPEQHQTWHDLLREIGDLERRVARLSARRSTPRELAQLYFSLRKALRLQQELPPEYESSTDLISSIQATIQLLEKHLLLQPSAPYIGEKPGEGEVIREGIDEKLDRARYLLRHAEEELRRLEEKERERLGIPNLKIQENRQLGYVFHITASYLSKVPPEYRLRQQLAQGTARYSSEELDKLNAEIASAQETVAEREVEAYRQLLEELQRYVPALQRFAQWVAEVDVHLGLAILARKYSYRRPRFTEEPRIYIKGGRHPVIERSLPPHLPYQPNDLLLTPEHRILLLTGPNMAGKSAYMRQNALIILLAQIGSFVPAEEAEIQPVDQIFSRVGSSDNLAAGQSTFLVEMEETAHILHQATARSFVILDEVGRGTSTYDGLAIAWAVVEYLHNHPHCRPWTLFATHYHELTELEKALPRLQNFHLAVEQRGEKVIFLHQLRRGPMRKSFGLAVAEKAGLPASLLARAQELLRYFEKKEAPLQISKEPTLFQLNPDIEGELRRRLLEIDPNTITPIEALFKLQELRSIAMKGM
ncbi:MAG: DNA mismatch repair protein MutS [Bacteroidia bacterium]|nr:DNA mismatch repair protein MutS [Bacteroidia bacterium]MCX7763274.1 DNA mismatch repair protein MutS [Bacteroidia bacterium]MDW8057571.1 DNA mismatch repair protein MutS [Bacteroidia bacterium]